ncbi:MAG: SBBP repeat-containing protein [Promethearchaeota archaeon]
MQKKIKILFRIFLIFFLINNIWLFSKKNNSLKINPNFPIKTKEIINKNKNLKIAMDDDWYQIYGGSNNDLGYGCAFDSNNNIYVVGTLNDNVNNCEDIVLIKYNSEGVLQWERTWDGGYSDKGYKCVIDSNGNIYVAGVSWKPGYSYDILILKYSNDGTLQWSKTWGTSNSEYLPVDIYIDQDGFPIICGTTINGSTGTSDIVFIKYQFDGTLIFYRIWGSPNEDERLEAVDYRGENTYVAITLNPSGPNYNIMCAAFKLDYYPDYYIWNRTYDSGVDEVAYDITVGYSGIYICGYKYIGISNHDGILIRYDFNDDFLGVQTWGFDKLDDFYGINLGPETYDERSDIYLTGVTYKNDICNLVIVRYDYQLNYLDYHIWDPDSSCNGQDIIILPNWNIYIVGSSSAYGSGSLDILLVKINRNPGPFKLSHNAGNPDKDGCFTLNWSISSDADNYDVFQYNSYITVINGSVQTLATGLTGNTFQITGLISGRYYFIIRANNAQGTKLSNCISVLVQIPPGSFNMGGTATNPDTDGKYNITWNPSVGADNYSVYEYNQYISEINNSVILIQEGIHSTHISITKKDDGVFYYRVVAVNKTGSTLSINCYKVNVRLPPGGFTLSASKYSVKIDEIFNFYWTPSKRATNYTIYTSENYINVLNGTELVVEKGIKDTLFSYKIGVSGVHYFIIVAINEIGINISNCINIKVTSEEKPLKENPPPENDSIWDLIIRGIIGGIISSVVGYFLKTRLDLYKKRLEKRAELLNKNISKMDFKSYCQEQYGKLKWNKFDNIWKNRDRLTDIELYKKIKKIFGKELINEFT